MSNLRKRFHMEALETRQMMAGDVAAYVQNGNLYINEAYGQYGLDNGVRVHQLANGMVRVEGAEANDGTANKSLVNGAAFQDFMIPGGLFVNLGGGHDRLHLGFDGAGSAPIFASMSINMAAPEMVIAQRSASLLLGHDTVFNTPDDDQVFGWGFHSRGGVTIKTGRGDDWVFIGTSTIGDGWGADNLTINTGAGADTASIKGTTLLGNLRIQTFANSAENDGDFVWLDSALDANFNTRATYITGNTEVYMGEGDDGFWIGDSTDPYFLSLGFMTLGSVHVSTAGGADSVDISAAKFGDANHWSNLSIYTGAGNDDVTVDFDSSLIDVGQPSPELTGGLFIHTYGSLSDTDADTVDIPIGQIWNSVYLYLGGGDDTFNLAAGNWGKYLTIDAGAGNDAGYAAGFLWNNADIRMGEGNDSMTLGHLRAYQLKLDGGNGVDSLRRLSPSAVDQLFQTGWEYINGRPTWWDDIVWDLQPATLTMARR
ncbi:MAG: hypothetical protein H0T51_02415 [Pirellulales bacterium]|nr:hypothetical protein [Pirellulales bacterium]